MAKIAIKSVVVLNVKENNKPAYDGWGNFRPYEMGVVTSSNSDISVIYKGDQSSFKSGHFYNSELLAFVKRPFVATFSSLGRGLATAFFDADTQEEAEAMAKSMVLEPTEKDLLGRSAKDLAWSSKSESKLSPVLISVVDKTEHFKVLYQLMAKSSE